MISPTPPTPPTPHTSPTAHRSGSTRTPRIALLPGDGIGPEVTEQAVRVLTAAGLAAEYIPADIGWRCWAEEGDPLPPRTLELLRTCDAALMGAITSKPAAVADRELAPHLQNRGLRYRSPIVRLRQEFDLYAAVRPCRALPGNPANLHDTADITVFRENTEGLYGGIEWRGLPEPLATAMADPATGHPTLMRRWFDRGLNTVAMSTRIVSEHGCLRICRAAFTYARDHGRRSVTLLDKPNVLRETGAVMQEAFDHAAAEFPTVEARTANIDAACMQMVMDPGRFDVVVAENMFGDIVSDLAAGLVGGLGFAPSANIGDSFAVFEPTHGSAPDIAGRGIANPTAAIRSAAMLAAWLGRADIAEGIESAVATALRDGAIDTPDVVGRGGRGTTASVTDAMIARLAPLDASAAEATTNTAAPALA